MEPCKAKTRCYQSTVVTPLLNPAFPHAHSPLNATAINNSPGASLIPVRCPIYTFGIPSVLVVPVGRSLVALFSSLLWIMFASLFNRGTLSLAVVSLLASTAAADVFERLASVPAGMQLPGFDRADMAWVILQFLV